jgi:hypothetical protein
MTAGKPSFVIRLTIFYDPYCVGHADGSIRGGQRRDHWHS